VFRSRPSLARTAALAALVFVATSLLSSAHEAAVQHVVCAAHGELSHVSLAAVGGPVRDAAVRPGGSAALDEHDHCVLASAMRESKAAPRAPAIAAAPIATPAPRGPAIAVAAPRTTPLYRSAPKTSPPA